MRRSPLFVLLVSLSGCPFCSTESADGYETSEMHASMKVTADGDHSTVAVAFQDTDQFLTFLELGDGDELTATVDGRTKRLERSTLVDLFGGTSYTADFDTCASNAEFRVALQRSGHASAGDSRAALPEAFTLVALPSDAFSRANDAITVAWQGAASSDPMEVSFDGDCIESYYADAPEEGATSVTVPAGSLRKDEHSDEPVADECKVEIKVTRTRKGSVDPAFEGGGFEAHQVRRLELRSTP